jgi:chemotaxis response regulator CheB
MPLRRKSLRSTAARRVSRAPPSQLEPAVIRGTAPRARARTARPTFPIVGIGASADGLEAFTQLLRALPLDTGLAFVLVQRLDPKHESLLTALLSHATPLPIHEVFEWLQHARRGGAAPGGDRPRAGRPTP